MNANITDEELRILAYLYETVKGYDQRYMLMPKELKAMTQSLELDDGQMHKCTSYLASHSLIGIRTIDVSSFDNPNEHIIRGIWLTGLGADYMRELENQTGLPQRMTVAALKQAGAVVREVAIKVLTAHLTGRP